VTGPGLRASDDDRHRVVAALERHTTAGRLSLDEFSERVGLAYAAATHADLARITEDLPVDAAAAVPAGSAQTPEHRQLLIAFLLAMATIVMLGIVLALAK
jgi:hypothetical protein